MWKAIASNALTLLIVGLFLLGGLVMWGKEQYSGPGPLSEAICLRVEPGSRMGRVADNLAEQGAVSSASIFRIGADYADKTDQLKAGSFLVQPGTSMEDIVDIITRGGANSCGSQIIYRIGINSAVAEARDFDAASGRYVEKAEFELTSEEPKPADFTRLREASDTSYRVVVAEGVTSWQVVDALSRIDVLDGDVPGIPEEGSLAPDSYEVRVGDDRMALIQKMQAKQELLLADAWANRVDNLPYDTIDEALIMASIIEKETGVPDERRQVASVFVNRLRQGMRLQTDPTVIYGITKGQGVLGRGLRQSELRGETPYNTYVIDALPPTPIANPGRASIEAALDPADTDFVFFVADGTGGHAFAVTLAEHNANVAKWRQIEADRSNN